MDNIEPITGAALFVIVALAAVYRCIILPGYKSDTDNS